ncbi:MAE_28990/MAE_18760 family HEPN-like nuclease [Isoptericola rhizosphaerae]|uniref:MAE_28990/MAE_18760 family HEPN-like nuclease n=1 Tax=Isoptericola rhizosphaerae TaxID=3377837 RepID=UPI00383B5F13
MAIDVLEDGVKEVFVLRDLAAEAELSGMVEQVNALRRSAVVLLVSHFEAFLKAVALEFVDAIGTGSIESHRLPRGVREVQSLPILEGIVSTKDPGQREALFKKLGSVSALWNGSAKPPAGSLDSQRFARIVTNADGIVIDELFERMGCSSKVCDGDIDLDYGDEGLATTNVRRSLSDVVKCRNDIAHGTSDRKPTTDDLERYLKFVVTLASRLQRRADSLVEAIVA